MKKYLALLFLPLVLFVASCTDSTTDAPPVEQTGSVVVQSAPVGARIFLDGVDAQKVTPDTLKNIKVGDHQVTLKLDGYYDSTFTVKATANIVTNWSPVILTTNTQLLIFGPVQIFETSGTTAAQPSGIDLSSGNAFGISSANKTEVDIYYTSNGFVVTSADNATGLTRKTYFKVGGASILTDGVSSSVKNSTWTDRMSDRPAEYVFLYDADMHYSKIIIDSYGGGSPTPGDPAWVKVKWIYNKTKDDVRFK